jgi:hypothetical protein
MTHQLLRPQCQVRNPLARLQGENPRANWAQQTHVSALPEHYLRSTRHTLLSKQPPQRKRYSPYCFIPFLDFNSSLTVRREIQTAEKELHQYKLPSVCFPKVTRANQSSATEMSNYHSKPNAPDWWKERMRDLYAENPVTRVRAPCLGLTDVDKVRSVRAVTSRGTFSTSTATTRVAVVASRETASTTWPASCERRPRLLLLALAPPPLPPQPATKVMRHT